MWVSAGAQVDGKRLVRDTDGSVWLRSEDAGWMDEEGRVWLVGRAKWRVRRAGRSHWSYIVEQKVSRHPLVLFSLPLPLPSLPPSLPFPLLLPPSLPSSHFLPPSLPFPRSPPSSHLIFLPPSLLFPLTSPPLSPSLPSSPFLPPLRPSLLPFPSLPSPPLHSPP